ncbi:hypothetical protein NMK54_17430 [Nocardia otitidiscaviarum]|uniref:hypothetical protein n=1 Tax=Nocardia otitidiscaviarum TaxID=1823 RepID=UPI0020CFA635|nr:hypothetical protein [Nocardia otitidiscaviarum]MCP9621933.1 hypothetical protein [Nocardia otitidiscaviarum]
MSWWVFAIGVVAAILLTAAAYAVAWLCPRHTPDGRSVAEIRQRLREERIEMEAAVWPVGYPHDAPDRPMGELEAQRTMQRHRSCRVGECPRKTAAWRTLVEAGRITPDSGRTF